MYVEHYVMKMDGSLVQRCVVCGSVISNYTRTMQPVDTPPPRGFDEGSVYVRKGKPTISTTLKPKDEEIVMCKPIKKHTANA